jgi:hypothetical protein
MFRKQDDKALNELNIKRGHRIKNRPADRDHLGSVKLKISVTKTLLLWLALGYLVHANRRQLRQHLDILSQKGQKTLHLKNHRRFF